jgi:hypothetical protein
MTGKRDATSGGRPGRSAEQQQAPLAMKHVMRVWDELTEEEYLAWRVAANSRRTKAISYFKMVNLRRLLREEHLTRLPPASKAFDCMPVLKGLRIRNQLGRLTLTLDLHRPLTEPMTLWGARPCNRGAAKPDKCPRLGWVSPGKSLHRDISQLYFKKHRAYLIQHRVPLVGKRIFIRLRREQDEGAQLYEQVQATVPPPEP